MTASSTAMVLHTENWQPMLEQSVQEVFEIMVGCQVERSPQSAAPADQEFTAMVGLTGALCGVVTFSCGSQAASQIAARMVGREMAHSDAQVGDALGEICNMVAGNFKNKLTGLAGRCQLSVPMVICGRAYRFRSLAAGKHLETVLLFEGAPIIVRLELLN